MYELGLIRIIHFCLDQPKRKTLKTIYPTFLFSLFLLSGCNVDENKQNLTGLWKLDEFMLDTTPTEHGDQYIRFDSTGVFNVAKTSGDIIGLFELKGDQLVLTSEEPGWYSSTWKISQSKDLLLLKAKIRYTEDEYAYDRLNSYRNTTLKFSRSGFVPDYQELHAELIGKWELLRIQTEEETNRMQSAILEINSDDEYFMEFENEIVEKGSVTINTRYRRLYFNDESSFWSISFLGNQLRLINKSKNIRYDLRKL